MGPENPKRLNGLCRRLHRLRSGALRPSWALAVLVAVTATCTHGPKRKTGPGAQAVLPVPDSKGDPFSILGKMKERPGDREFRLASGPKPPKRVTDRVQAAFPPPVKPTGVRKSYGKVRVLRTQPKGNVQSIAAVTVTFNQPMVPLTSLEQLRAIEAPMKIQPMPPGRFRWLGTSVVSYESPKRFPYSTEYSVRIPQGTRSAVGNVLEKEQSFSFETPRVHLDSSLPYRNDNHAVPETPIVLFFNQKVKDKVVAEYTTITGFAGKKVEFDVVGPDGWQTLTQYGKQSKGWDRERTVVFMPKRPLAKNTSYSINIKKGLPSEEGPLRTKQGLYSYFRTYGPMYVTFVGCYWNSTRCSPGSSLHLRFTNGVRTDDKELKKYITVSPAVEDLELQGSGSYVYMSGSFKPATTYLFTVKPGIGDIYNQKMERVFKGKVWITDARPELSMPTWNNGVLEARTNRKLAVRAVNVPSGTVTLVEVKPKNVFKAFEVLNGWSYKYRKNGKAPSVPGRRVVYSRKFNTKRNKTDTLFVKLDRILKGRGGTVFVQVYSPALRPNRWSDPYRYFLAQVTDVGLTARYDHDQIVVLATELTSGKPASGVEVMVRRGDNKQVFTGLTDSRGIVVAPGIRKLQRPGNYLVCGRKTKDWAFLVLDGSGEDAGYVSGYYRWGSIPAERYMAYHVFTDRNPYRPGDTVHIVGIIRSQSNTTRGGLEPVKGTNLKIRWEIRDARYQKVAKGKAPVDKDGTFKVDYKSKTDGSLGHYRFNGYLEGGTNVPGGASVYAGFQILAYRAPEYEVTVNVKEGPYFFGDKLDATVNGRYTFGAPMAGAETTWTLRRQPGTYRPPGHDDFTFGIMPPWRWHWGYRYGRRGGRYGGYFSSTGPSGKIIAQGKGELDDNGMLALTPVLERGKDKERLNSAGSYTLEAQVFDVNRQSIAGRKVTVVHPASVYVGLRLPKTIVKVGERAHVQSVLVNLDGGRVSGKSITVQALRRIWERKMVKEGKYWTYKHTTRRVEAGRCSTVSAADVRSCALTLRKPGVYELDASAVDAKGRKTITRTRLYVAGKSWIPWRQDNQNRIELVSDKKSYKPGDRARVLIKNPFRRALGILSVERNGIVEHRYLNISSSTHVEEVQLAEQQIPNLYVSVALVRGRVHVPGGKTAAEDLGRPRFATGRINLKISVEKKKIYVGVKPARTEIRPGDTLRVAFRTTDLNGKPIRSRLAVMVVDEGVLSLLGYTTPDPLAVFHGTKSTQSALEDLRARLLKKVTKKPRPKPTDKTRSHRQVTVSKARLMVRSMPATGIALGGSARAPMPVASAEVSARPSRRRGDAFADEDGSPGRGGGGAGPAFKTRTHFATTAYFKPDVLTDGSGRAELNIKMPENLTAFRIMAVAADSGRADRFGSGESKVRIRKELLLRPALPRFSNFGDRFEASVVVNNETRADGTATVKIQGTGFAILGPDTKEVAVRKGKAAEVRFKVMPVRPGLIRFRFSAIMGRYTDSVEPPPIHVHLPATTEATATYGVTTKSVAQPIVPPPDALPQFGGLNVSMSSTALTGLQDAVKFLIDYPYECAEQTASRIVPIFALGDILAEFNIGKVKDRDLQKKLARAGIRKLLSLQRYDGGFAFWPGSWRSSPYTSVYVTWALLRGRQAGFKVRDQALQSASNYVSRVMKGQVGWPWNLYWELRIMAGWVLTEMRNLKFIPKSYKKYWHLNSYLGTLYGHRNQVGTFAKAWLLTAFHRIGGNAGRVAELKRLIENAAVQTPSGAHFAERVTESLRLLLHSESRTDSIVLDSFMETDPDNVLIPKIVRALMSARVKGRWETTQSNAYAMHGLATYFRKYEKVVPDFVAHLWLKDGYAGTGTFKGRSMKITEKRVPMSFVLKQGPGDLILAKSGPGKLYYRLGLSYAPRSLRLPPEEQGFMVTRVYEPVEGKETVSRGKDGVWRIQAGKYIRVRLTVVVPDRRYYVAVDDPLPAGLEGVDLQLKTSASSRLGGKVQNKIYDFWSWYAFRRPDHKEMRDDRYVIFWDRLPSGVYEYTYLARATTIGRFVVPPLKAHEMYHPEVFGRNGTAIVQVVP